MSAARCSAQEYFDSVVARSARQQQSVAASARQQSVAASARQQSVAASARQQSVAASARQQQSVVSSTRRTPNFAALNSFVASRTSATAAAASVPAARSAAQAKSRTSGYRQQAASRTASGSQEYRSQVEQALRDAQDILTFTTTDREVQVGQFKGYQLNEDEERQFRGPLPLEQYRFSQDSNPEYLRKVLQPTRYVQKVLVRSLQPPTPAPAGNLLVREVRTQLPPAPPVILREEGRAATTPCPIVYREQPPRTPTPVPEQVVEIEGEPIQPPARKVVFERLPDEAAKPANVLIEKWLPYGPRRRQVIFERAEVRTPVDPRNLVIEWEQPEAEVEQVCEDLGVERADPNEYRQRYGNELRQTSELPDFCGAAERPSVSRSGEVELVGDVDALRYVDLEAYGLGQYRRYVQ